MSHRRSAADAPVDHLRLIVGSDGPACSHAAFATDEFDALADLFLDEPASRSTPPAHMPSSAPIPRRIEPARQAAPDGLELVVSANVPRPIGGWLVAHARTRAASLRAPALLIRADDGLADAQRVEPHAGHRREAGSTTCAHTIIVASDSDTLDASLGKRVQRITVLSGAGETGAIAAYAVIKRLAATQSAKSGSGPSIGVCFVGATREKALVAHRALRRACESFLATHVEFAGSIERPDHAPCETVWRSSEGSLAEAVREAERTERSPSTASPTTTRTQPARRAPARSVATPAQDTFRPAPPPVPTLREEIELPARCPEAREVRFRVDPQGGLHLHVEDAAASAADAAAGLLAASAWAERHHDTLDALAQAAGAPALRTDKPVCHLTTRDARRVRPYLDTSLRLDVLAVPERPGEPVRVALN